MDDFKIILQAIIDNSSLDNIQKQLATERLKATVDIDADLEKFAKSNKNIEEMMERLADKISIILNDAIDDKQAMQWAKQYYKQMVDGAKAAAKEQEKLNALQQKQTLATQEKHYKKINQAEKERLDIQRKIVSARGEERKILQAQYNKRVRSIDRDNNYLDKHNLKDNNLTREVSNTVAKGSERINLDLAKEINDVYTNLNKLESEWKEQGILVGDFADKVTVLKSLLKDIKLGGQLDIDDNIKKVDSAKNILSELTDSGNSKINARNQVKNSFEQRISAYKEILTINEKINRLNPETDSAQIKDLENQRSEWQKINQIAAETMEYYSKQVLSEEELLELTKSRAIAMKKVQNEVASSFAVQDEQNRNKKNSSVSSRIASLDDKLDTEQYKYTQKYIYDQIEALQKYGVSANEAEAQTKELQNAFNAMSDKSLSAQERLDAEKKFQTELNRTAAAVKEAKTEWQGLVTVQQRLTKANAIEAFLQKNTRITKEARDELERYVASLRDVDTAMSKVAKNNIDIRFKEIENSMRGLNKLGYALTDQMKQAATSFAQWISVSNLIMTGVYRTREAVNELIEVDNILTEISKTSDMTKQELIALGDASFETASKLGRNATDYLNTVMDMSRSGFYGEQGEAMAKQVLLAQTAGDLSQELASNYVIATNAAYKFGGDVEKINKVIDGANLITNRYSVAMADMAESMSIAGTVAASYRVNPDELSAMTGVIESVTKLGGNEVGNALKAILINLQNITSSKIVGTLSKAGASMTEVVNGVEQMRDPVEILKDLATTFNSLDEKDPLRAEILTNIGQKYHAQKLAALLSNMDKYDEMLVTYAQGTGSAAIEAEKSANNIQGSLNRLSNTWTDIINNMLSSDTMLLGINTLNEFLTLINSATGALGDFGSIGMLATGIASAKGYGLNHSLQPLFIKPCIMPYGQRRECFGVNSRLLKQTYLRFIS